MAYGQQELLASRAAATAVRDSILTAQRCFASFSRSLAHVRVGGCAKAG